MYTTGILTALLVSVTIVSAQTVYEDVETLREVLSWCEKYGYYTGEVEKLNKEELKEALIKPVTDAKTFLMKFEEINADITDQLLEYVRTPRCGDKDVKIDKATGNSRTKRWARFKNNPHLWKSFPLVLSISQLSTTQKYLRDKIDRAAFTKILLDSMKTWSTASGVSFKFDPNNIAPHIMVSFGKIGAVGVVGTSDGPKDGSRDEVSSIHINSESPFKMHYRLSGPGYSLKWTLMHELGHAMGLGHSSDNKAIMYAYGTSDYNDQVLTQDDINGITSLYGPSNGRSVEVSTSAPRKFRQRAPVVIGRAPVSRSTTKRTTTTKRPNTRRTTRRATTRRTTRRATTRRTTPYPRRTTYRRRTTTRRTTPYRRSTTTRRPYVHRKPTTTTTQRPTPTLRRIVSYNQRPPVTFRTTRTDRPLAQARNIPAKLRRFMAGK